MCCEADKGTVVVLGGQNAAVLFAVVGRGTASLKFALEIMVCLERPWFCGGVSSTPMHDPGQRRNLRPCDETTGPMCEGHVVQCRISS